MSGRLTLALQLCRRVGSVLPARPAAFRFTAPTALRLASPARVPVAPLSTSAATLANKHNSVPDHLDPVSSPKVFAAGRRTYEVALLSEPRGNSFLKLTEFSSGRKSSILLHASDVEGFLVEFVGLEFGKSSSPDQDGGFVGRPESLGQGVVGFAQVRCSFKEGKFFELSLNSNRHGMFYRLKEKNMDNVGMSMVMMEALGKDQLVKSFEQFLQEHPERFAEAPKVKRSPSTTGVTRDELA